MQEELSKEIVKNLEVNGNEVVAKIFTAKGLDEKEPNKLKLQGNISAVSEYLKNRHIVTDKCHVIIDREVGYIKLVLDENSPYSGFVGGYLNKTQDLKSWRINSDQCWEPEVLANHVKMNRHCFESKETAMSLHSLLKNFKAKVNRDIEKKSDDRGNNSLVRQQAVDSNLPEAFNLFMPVFSGEEKLNFKVEVNIHPSTLECMLVSPDLKDFISEQIDILIDREKAKILEYTDSLVIVEV